MLLIYLLKLILCRYKIQAYIGENYIYFKTFTDSSAM